MPDEYDFYINRKDDEIFVSVHDQDGNAVESFRLHNNHPALNWDDDRLKSYLTKKLHER